MRRILIALCVACGSPQRPTTVEIAPSPSASASVTPVATAHPSASASVEPPDVIPATFQRCAQGQLNTPCVFEREGACFIRRSESQSDPVDCDVFRRGTTSTACTVASHCNTVSDEGCEIGGACANLFHTCIDVSCAPRVERATTCAEVEKILSNKSCRRR